MACLDGDDDPATVTHLVRQRVEGPEGNVVDDVCLFLSWSVLDNGPEGQYLTSRRTEGFPGIFQKIPYLTPNCVSKSASRRWSRAPCCWRTLLMELIGGDYPNLRLPRG